MMKTKTSKIEPDRPGPAGIVTMSAAPRRVSPPAQPAGPIHYIANPLMPILSKSKLLAFRQCPKRLWLEIHRPELWAEASATSASLRTGWAVGQAARRIYDPASLGEVIDAGAEGCDGALSRTADLLTRGHRPIFEAGLAANGLLAFVDVLVPQDEGGKVAWKMVEVKASTSLKDYHRDDLAIQTWVARAAGIRLQSVVLALVDGAWSYAGNGDYRGLLQEHDLTAETLARCTEVREWIEQARTVAHQSDEPAILPGPQCHQPFACGFCRHCNEAAAPSACPLEWLPDLSAAKRQKLAQKGIHDLRAVPDDLLTPKQILVKKHTLAGTVFFDAAGAAADLAGQGWPAGFLDFETIQFAVPLWRGTRPYQQIPFQFSLHRLDENGDLSQASFLDLSGNDPSEPLARALLCACGGQGPVYAYNAGFEKSRIAELAERYPALTQPLSLLKTRIVDLLPLARQRYYHPSQQGSWSIKKILPAIFPDLSYGRLAGVNDGASAMEAFTEAIASSTTAEWRRAIQEQLLAYCGLDTYGLARLWCFLSGRRWPKDAGDGDPSLERSQPPGAAVAAPLGLL